MFLKVKSMSTLITKQLWLASLAIQNDRVKEVCLQQLVKLLNILISPVYQFKKLLLSEQERAGRLQTKFGVKLQKRLKCSLHKICRKKSIYWFSFT